MDKWTALEIIVVLILLIGLLERISGHQLPTPPTPTPVPSSNPHTAITDPANPWCGLSIVSPQSKQSVSASFALVGNVNGCNWPTTQTTALFAQVIDANGLPLSDYLPIPITTKNGTTAQFATTLALTQHPTTKTGYLILVPTTGTPGNTLSVRISLTFLQ